MKSVVPFFLFPLFLIINVVLSADNILMPFERFQYDLALFLPVVKQEVEFAELSNLTDDQAFEQLKTFFPSLQQRIQELRNTGLIADELRVKNKEAIDKMCGQGHRFGYLLVSAKLTKMNEVLNTKKITAANNSKMLSGIYTELKNWELSSKAPCHRLHTGK
ncbi:DUF148 domain-containing protein [Caenorhabditis elegans]|uniref:DUF148 domain-containing protein n=1 Tax=Caenorhabditis elegans TaxID=6239 RepID=Q9XWQ8_CAEEL|nr:DUF148 domain-containing protein [Caenorhabditis elegans]CAA21590.1 DUF148 domain-containing protein [Caenorhabditis elegans]|eukprot:NP_501610.1 Uncharacterized protein CELE_Y11D7A.5 [Caenorhabditis elegans]